MRVCRMSRGIKLAVDERSIRMVVNYRQHQQIKQSKSNQDMSWRTELYEQVVLEDGHSGGSHYWTRTQSAFIDKHGWDVWWQTEGPLGYGVFLERHAFKD